MRNNRIEGPVETWRGSDPECAECGGLMTYANFFVRAPCDEVLQVLLEDPELPKRVADLLMASPLGICGDPVYVYQLRGHEWTQVDSFGEFLASNFAEPLSRRLGTVAFHQTHWDQGEYYEILEAGERIEAFGNSCESAYQWEGGAAELQQRRAEGWRIARDFSYELFTRRDTNLDIESWEECAGLPERAIGELEMFVAWRPWYYAAEQRGVGLSESWPMEYFHGAKALYRIEADLPPKQRRR